MKNSIRNGLNRELEGVKVSADLKRRIMTEAMGGERAERRRSPLAALAAAAAVIVLLGATLGMISLRTEHDDRRSTALTQGNEDWVWISDSDALYHSASPCGDMSGAVRVKLEQAKREGRAACPDCVKGCAAAPEADGSAGATPEPVPEPLPTPLPETLTVWTTDGGLYYHVREDCSGMLNARRTTVAEADAAGKLPCPACIEPSCTPVSGAVEEDAHAGETIMPAATPEPTPPVIIAYDMETGGIISAASIPSLASDGFLTAAEDVYYHADGKCVYIDASASYSVTDTAGKSPCPMCLSFVTPKPAPQSELYYWATQNGVYYHADEHCSGMRSATQYTGAEAVADGKLPCPACMAAAAATPAPQKADGVWVTNGGAYCHVDAACGGMEDAVQLPLMEALQKGYVNCPACMNWAAVWHTEGGAFYHYDSGCSGMQNAVRDSESGAVQAGKQPCPVCVETGKAGQQEPTFFAEPEGRYYHTDTFCGGTENAQAYFPDEAEDGKQPCPVCVPGAGDRFAAESTAELTLRLAMCGDRLLLGTVYTPLVEWIVNPASYEAGAQQDFTEMSADDAAELLSRTGLDYMTVRQAEDFNLRLAAGEIVGFRSILYRIEFREEAEKCRFIVDEDEAKMQLVLSEDVENVYPASGVVIRAFEVACYFDAQGNARMSTRPLEAECVGVHSLQDGKEMTLAFRHSEAEEEELLINLDVGENLLESSAAYTRPNGDCVELLKSGDQIVALIDFEDLGDAGLNFRRAMQIREDVRFYAPVNVDWIDGEACNPMNNSCAFLLTAPVQPGEISVEYE